MTKTLVTILHCSSWLLLEKIGLYVLVLQDQCSCLVSFDLSSTSLSILLSLLYRPYMYLSCPRLKSLFVVIALDFFSEICEIDIRLKTEPYHPYHFIDLPPSHLDFDVQSSLSALHFALNCKLIRIRCAIMRLYHVIYSDCLLHLGRHDLLQVRRLHGGGSLWCLGRLGEAQ